MQRFEFRFDYPLAAPLAAVGITPRTAHVDVGNGEVLARFGPWVLRTPIDNVVETDVTGPYRWWTVVGVRLSMVDRGITFGSNAHRGLCLGFAEAVPAILPGHRLRHPGATLTVADPRALETAIRRG
jgi:hypothetical protein